MLTPGLGVRSPPLVPIYGADRWSDRGDLALANHEPIAQRGHQQRQRQQVDAPLDLDHGPVVPAGRLGVMLGRAGLERARAAVAAGVTSCADGSLAIGALCGRCVGGGAQRVLDAGRGDPAGHRCLSGDRRP